MLALHFHFVHSYNCQLCSSQATFYLVCLSFLFAMHPINPSIFVVLHWTLNISVPGFKWFFNFHLPHLYIMADIIHSLHIIHFKYIDKVLFIISIFVKWSLSGCYTLFYFISVFFFCLMLFPVLRKFIPGPFFSSLSSIFMVCFFLVTIHACTKDNVFWLLLDEDLI